MKSWLVKVESMITCSYTHHGKGKGIFRNRLRFPNGWAVSWVAAEHAAPIRLYSQHNKGQWEDFTDEQWATTQDFESVEVAIFNPQEKLVPFKSGDTVKGWVKSTELVEIFAWTAQQS